MIARRPVWRTAWGPTYRVLACEFPDGVAKITVWDRGDVAWLWTPGVGSPVRGEAKTLGGAYRMVARARRTGGAP